jgi:putative acetyltransferase
MINEQIHSVGEADRERLVEVWEASVRATHHFLSEADIQLFKPLVRDGLIGSLELAGIRDATGQLVAFVGVAGRKIEALFVHPQWRGIGLGRRLLLHAIQCLGATKVDVNEQNEQATRFYQRLGFVTDRRSEVDEMGLPFPLLHMELAEPPGADACQTFSAPATR